MATLPMATFVAAPKMTEVCAPAATVNEPAGLAVTPAGIPVKVTCTEPLKPFSAVTITFTAELEEPCATETEPGETASRKSGAGGATKLLAPPPQPKVETATSTRATAWTRKG